MRALQVGLAVFTAIVAVIPFSLAGDDQPPVDQFISSGDNHFLGNSIPVDSRASIEATFDMFKGVFDTRRIYWRGLQGTAWVKTMHVRDDNFRYGGFHYWERHLYNDLKIEKLAVEIAHKKGMELWGVSTLGDWGSPADTAGFNDFPFNCESKLRIEHPEWVPVDKYGYRKQGGTIELAYPEARKALVDLHVQLAREAGYDGVIFLTYVENFSLRFQDEFGYSEPIVQEFKKRYGIDIRQEEFTRYASLYDWRKLRGEYVTLYFKELRAALKAEGIAFGVFLNPQDIRKPLIWATLPYDYQTIGNMHMDVDAWLREGVVDRLIVWGGAAPSRIKRTLDDLQWLTRGTDVRLGAMSSNPLKAFADVNPAIERVASLDEESAYLSRSIIPEQTVDVLASGTIYEKMKFLSQVIEKTSVCTSDKILPLLQSENLLMRRLALKALGVIKDPQAVPSIEAALSDPEIGVRCAAISALGFNHRPESLRAVLNLIEKDDSHPLCEMARSAIPKFQPSPAKELVEAIAKSQSPAVRTLALRTLGMMPVPPNDREAAVDALIKGLSDSNAYARYSAAMSLAQYKASPKAVGALINTMKSQDATTADRAALSLAEMVTTGYDGDLKPQIFTGMQELFRQFGDGTVRPDKDWGHRSVGNALLAFGEEGQGVLREWMKQTNDQRLAEMAWQVLSFREKAGDNKFNVISEKENEAAYKARPAHMKRLLVEKISQDFEGELPAEGSFGDSEKTMGRWSALGPKGQFLEKAKAGSGSNAIKLVRSGGVFMGWVNHGVSDGYGYEASVRIRRSAGGALTFSLQDRKRTESIALRVDAAGNVSYKDPQDPAKWLNSDLNIGANAWTTLAILADPLGGTYKITLNPKGDNPWNDALVAPLLTSGAVDRVTMSALSDSSGEILIDDFKLIERH